MTDQAILDILLAEVKPALGCTGPVSYTHLDVYKRQSGWEAITPPMWMCGSSLRPIRICTGRWRRIDSAKTFITASASCPYISRRFATGARISRSCSVFLWSNDRSNLRSPLLYAVFSSHIPGREIYGNCAILWNISRFLANPSWGQRIFRAAVRRYLSLSLIHI